MDGKKYWSHDDPYDDWEQPNDSFILRSDSFKRADYNALLTTNNYLNVQKLKDELEDLQRKDRNLREKINKK